MRPPRVSVWGRARRAGRTESSGTNRRPAERKTRRGSGAGRASRRDESGDVRRLRRSATPRVSVRGAHASRPKPPATGTPRSARRSAFIRRPAEAPSRAHRRQARGLRQAARAGGALLRIPQSIEDDRAPDRTGAQTSRDEGARRRAARRHARFLASQSDFLTGYKVFALSTSN